MKVAVIGTGYVGLVTGLVLADLGNEVHCVDKDLAKIELLLSGNSPIFEPGVEEILKRTLKNGNFIATPDLSMAVAKSEIVFIAVGTPPGPDGAPDLSAVRQVAKEIGQAIDKPTLVVNKSTVPVGSGDLVEQIILDQGVSADMFDVLSNPEFLREGSAISDTLNPDRVVIGTRRVEAAEKLKTLYAPLNTEFIVTDLNSAELIKYGANSFLAMKISFINAMSRICELCGADIGDVAKGIGSDARIGSQFLSAGLGWGGSCFPKDVQGMVATAANMSYDFGLLKEVTRINEDQIDHFIRRIEHRLGGFEGKTIGILGLSFKPNTDDIRDAKSLIILDRILAKGGAVRAYDPVASDLVAAHFPGATYVDSAYEVSDGADAIVLVTEWNEFRQIDLPRLASGMRQAIMFDGRRVYSPQSAITAGWEYHTIGTRSL